MKVYSEYFSKKITFLNVLLTFFIVVLHAKTPERWGLNLSMDYPFIYWMTVFAQLCVPSFFFISGLLFFDNCKFIDIERKLKSRVKSLLIPYIIWNSFFVFLFFILSHISFFNEKMNMGEDVLGSVSEITNAIIHSRYTVLWFVKDLMIMMAFSCLIFLMLERKRLAWGVFILSVIAACVMDIGYESVYRWFPLYFLGAIYSRFYLRKHDGEYIFWGEILSINSRKYLSFILMFLFICLLLLAGLNEKYLFIYRLLSPIIIWFIIDFFLMKYIQVRFKVHVWMKYMFFIYCTHHFLLNVVQKIVVIYFSPTPLVLNLTYILSIFIVFYTLIIVAKYLSQYQFYKYLSGGR